MDKYIGSQEWLTVMPKYYALEVFWIEFDRYQSYWVNRNRMIISSTWVEKVLRTMRSVISKNSKDIVSVIWWLEDNYNDSIMEYYVDDIINKFHNRILYSVKDAHEKWQTYILCFSFLWHCYSYNKIFDIVKNIKENYDNVIVVWWWVEFNKIDDPLFIEMFFDNWFDYINIWWEIQFCNWIWNLGDQDNFLRSNDWMLIYKWKGLKPNNVISKGWMNDYNWEIWKFSDWNNIYYSKSRRIVLFWFNKYSCLNNCFYCSPVLSWTSQPLLKCDIDKSIIDYNEFANWVTEKYSLTITHPNPFQNFNLFADFLRSIDLSRCYQISFFWDYPRLSKNWMSKNYVI